MEKEGDRLNPGFVSGFTDGEGCFYVGISKDSAALTGWCVKASFKIALNVKDIQLLKEIKTFFGGVGNIGLSPKSMSYFEISNLKDIIKYILPHFCAGNKYPLLTNKHADYKLWRAIAIIMQKKGHLTTSGLQEIVNIKSSLNKGLSSKLEEAFPLTKPVIRPNVPKALTQDSYWIAGFASGEGCFIIRNQVSPKSKLGFAVSLAFQISQHSRDELLLTTIADYLGCGMYVRSVTRSEGVFSVTKLKDILNIIIPLFRKYKLLGVKVLDF